MPRMSRLSDWTVTPMLEDDRFFYPRAWLPVLVLVGLSVLVALLGASIDSMATFAAFLVFLLVFYGSASVVLGAIYGVIRRSISDDHAARPAFWRNAAVGSTVSAALWLGVTLVAFVVD